MTLLSEIQEQPDVLAGLLSKQRKNIEIIAQEIKAYKPRFVFLAARGTSDNAGRYANYTWGALNRLPVTLATPSLFTLYEQPPLLDGALVLGISQSGQSPDIVSVLVEGQRQGCKTMAITNTVNSPLALAADWVVDIQAGPERAVAATKTYTSELMGIAMLSAALRGDPSMWNELGHAPDWLAQVLKQTETIRVQAERYRYMERCVVLGRGYNYATAFEWSLKIKELTYTIAEPYSFADFQHGPIAMVEPGFPVLAVAVSGKTSANALPLLSHLKEQLQAELVVISDLPEALKLGQTAIRLPAGMPEWLSPLAAIVAGQLFAWALTEVKGYDTEKPRSIRKVTETQ